jgi:hypothetical protein
MRNNPQALKTVGHGKPYAPKNKNGPYKKSQRSTKRKKSWRRPESCLKLKAGQFPSFPIIAKRELRSVMHFRWKNGNDTLLWLRSGVKSLFLQRYRRSQFSPVSLWIKLKHVRIATQKFMSEALNFVKSAKSQMGVEIFLLAGWRDNKGDIKKAK